MKPTMATFSIVSPPAFFGAFRCRSAPLASVRSQQTRVGSVVLHRRRSGPSRRHFVSHASTAEVTTDVKYLEFSNNAVEWSDLEKILEQRKKDVGAGDVNPETGPPNCLAQKRTFGKDEPIRVKLYRDPAAWCPFCQKVWMHLEEKEIPYEVEFIPLGSYGKKPDWYLEKFPKGLVPNMEIDGETVMESQPIMEKLEEVFPEKPLLPEGAELGKVLKGIDQWALYVRGKEGSEEEFLSQVDGVEAILKESGGPYFLGKDFSLVDIDAMPILERMNATILYYKGIHLRKSDRWPALGKWFEAMESRPSYIWTKSDYFTSIRVTSRLISGEISEKGKPFADAIDGKNGAWKLPLGQLSDHFEYEAGENPEMDRYLAAKKLIENREAVVGFALRGCDENDRDGAKNEVECALRHVAAALLNGTDASSLKVSKDEGMNGENAVLALEYLRERVGVPRDFRLPQARQFRAHLNWMIDSVTA